MYPIGFGCMHAGVHMRTGVCGPLAAGNHTPVTMDTAAETRAHMLDEKLAAKWVNIIFHGEVRFSGIHSRFPKLHAS